MVLEGTVSTADTDRLLLEYSQLGMEYSRIGIEDGGDLLTEASEPLVEEGTLSTSDTERILTETSLTFRHRQRHGRSSL